MKNIYKRNAFYLDEDVLLYGYKDKYGFHPNEETNCGFTLQKINKKDVNKKIFYTLSDAVKILGPVNVSGAKIIAGIDAGLYITRVLFSVGDGEIHNFMTYTLLSENQDNIQDIINEALNKVGIKSLHNESFNYKVVESIFSTSVINNLDIDFGYAFF